MHKQKNNKSNRLLNFEHPSPGNIVIESKYSKRMCKDVNVKKYYPNSKFVNFVFEVLIARYICCASMALSICVSKTHGKQKCRLIQQQLKCSLWISMASYATLYYLWHDIVLFFFFLFVVWFPVSFYRDKPLLLATIFSVSLATLTQSTRRNRVLRAN